MAVNFIANNPSAKELTFGKNIAELKTDKSKMCCFDSSKTVSCAIF
jgi:hypothetical protein